MAINFLNTVAVDESVLFVDTVNDRVGIGTTSPVDALDVDWDEEGVATDLSGIRVRAYRPHLNLIDRSGYSTTNGHNFQIKADIAKLQFNATSADNETFDLIRMVIDKDGQVGIGTSNPTSLLEISQQLSAASTIDYPYTISSRDDGNSINQAGGEGVGIKFRIAGNDATTPGNSLVGASIAAIRESASDTDSSTGLGFFVTQNDETLDEALRIDQDGKVGIGTTSPGTKLTVSENAAGLASSITNSSSSGSGVQITAGNGTNNSLQIRNYAGGELMRVQGNGNVGIGMTDPSANLHVESTNDGMTNGINTNQLKLSYGASVNGAGSSIAFGVSAVSNFTGAKIVHERKDGNSAGDLSFWTRELVGTATDYDLTAERMRISSSGNVGIDTDNPSEKLDVVGNIKITSALLSNQNNTDVDTGTEAIASVVLATYTAAFFDFVIKKGTNVRSGTVYACHDGTNVEFTETSTNDLGDTSDVTLNVVISTIYLQLQATTTSDDWSVKSLIRAI